MNFLIAKIKIQKIIDVTLCLKEMKTCKKGVVTFVQ